MTKGKRSELMKLMWQKSGYRSHMSKVHKGQPAWNKGKHIQTNTGRTHFKKGLIPWSKKFKGLPIASKIFGKFREAHFNWKGGKRIDVTGYMRILVGGKYILEHRYIMQTFLRRKLKDNEVVHHINGNKIDNRIKNLKLFKNNKEHLIFHKKRGQSAKSKMGIL